LSGGLNTYTYVYNNPLRYTDPQGLFVGALASRVVVPALEYLGTAIAGSAIGVSIYNAVKGDVEADAPDGPFSWVDPGRQTTNDKLKEDWENQTGESWPVDPDTGKSIKICIHLGATVVVGEKDVGENAHNE